MEYYDIDILSEFVFKILIFINSFQYVYKFDCNTLLITETVRLQL